VHYIGVDYHKKYSYVVVKDREGKVSNTKEDFWQLLKPESRQTRLAVTSSVTSSALIFCLRLMSSTKRQETPRTS